MKTPLKVGARSSPLSLKQVEELFRAFPDLAYELISLETLGDKDLLTSLRSLSRCDFFTRELDQLLLEEEIDIAVHSAKDLPEPLPPGLELIALTACIDPRDSLVYCTENIRRVATSSKKREEAVAALFPEATFCDIRGTIAERIGKLNPGKIDGVVIAEAALLRLGYQNLPRYYLPGETTANQGRLAVVARSNQPHLRTLFERIDVRALHGA